MPPHMHRLKWAVLLVAAISFAPTATALELVMVRRAGCPWCAAWDREIAPIYGKTDIGRQAPVRLVDLEHISEMKLALQSPVRFTPTFVLVDEDREIGRIEGYPGEDFFWGMVERLLPTSPKVGIGLAPAPMNNATR
jgi:thioredoxin-related protein